MSSSKNKGNWNVKYRSKIVGIHAALLNNGRIILFSYPSREHNDNHDDEHAHSIFGSASHHGVFEIINPANWKGEDPKKIKKNVFCGGHCFLDDGNLFVSGGQYQTVHNPILLVDPPSICTHTFSAHDYEWKLRQRSFLARWYPSCIALSNGTILIMSGSYGIYGIKKVGPFNFVNNRLEIYSKETGLKTIQKIPFRLGLYPFLYMLPNGHVFVHSERTTRIYDVNNRSWIKFKSTNKLFEIHTNYEYSRTNPVQGASVILPFKKYSTEAKIMLIGGGGKSDDPKIDTPATETCEIIEFKGDKESESDIPAWRYTTNMNFKRVMPDAVLLPNKKVLVVNGTEKGKSDAGQEPVLIAELYDPENESWVLLNEMEVPRFYHSNALLLSDGTVMTSGTDKEWNKGREHDEYRIEVFTPPYLMKGSLSEGGRPDIKNVKLQLQYDEVVSIESDQAEEINSVTIIKSSSVTHSLNTDQRCIELEILGTKKNYLTVRMPNSANFAPPGYYMIFILDKDETPSKSKFIQLLRTK